MLPKMCTVYVFIHDLIAELATKIKYQSLTSFYWHRENHKYDIKTAFKSNEGVILPKFVIGKVMFFHDFFIRVEYTSTLGASVAE